MYPYSKALGLSATLILNLIYVKVKLTKAKGKYEPTATLE